MSAYLDELSIAKKYLMNNDFKNLRISMKKLNDNYDIENLTYADGDLPNYYDILLTDAINNVNLEAIDKLNYLIYKNVLHNAIQTGMKSLNIQLIKCLVNNSIVSYRLPEIIETLILVENKEIIEMVLCLEEKYVDMTKKMENEIHKILRHNNQESVNYFLCVMSNFNITYWYPILSNFSCYRRI